MAAGLIEQLLALGYRLQAGGADLISLDGREIYEFKLGGRGVRDLRDSALHLAVAAGQEPQVGRGILLIELTRISPERVRGEWDSIQRVILPQISNRLEMLAMVDGTEVRSGAKLVQTPAIEQFIAFTRRRVSPQSSDELRSGETGDKVLGSWKHLEVEKVLVRRWLMNEGPVAIGTLSEQVGCSYPTASEAIGYLSSSGLIQRGRGRSVALVRYGREQWEELFRRQRSVYRQVEFVDATGEAGVIDPINRRLERMHPKGAAMGGVMAARRWDALFDLNGTPRLDLVIHTPVKRWRGKGEWLRQATEIAQQVDPALRRRSAEVRGATVLVLHPMYRKDPLFFDETPPLLPRADPVEVLYHLHGLGLMAQASELVRHLRQGTKHEQA